MVKLELSLQEPGMLGLETWARGIDEFVVLDTNILLNGIYPNLAKKNNGRGYWLDDVRDELAMEKWIRDYKTLHQDGSVPVIVETVDRELRNFRHSEYPEVPYEIAEWRNRMTESENAFFISLKGRGKLPDTVVDTLNRYGKDESHVNDLKILASAYSLLDVTPADVTLVTKDTDFNAMTQNSLRRVSPHDHYLHLRQAGRFTRDHHLPLPTNRLQQLEIRDDGPRRPKRTMPRRVKTEVVLAPSD